MFDGLLSGTVGFLALLGGVALVVRLVRSAMIAMLSAAEMVAASGMAEAGARRGDLTALSEGRAAERSARLSRRRSLAAAMVFLLWLSAPVGLGAAAEAYAIAAPLWLVPLTPLRHTRAGSGSREARDV